MRRLLVILILIALVVGGLWAGGQSLLAREMRQALNDGTIMAGALTAGEVTPLRDPARFGVAVQDLRLDGPTFGISLPQIKAAAPLTRPNELRLNLPDSGTVTLAGRPLPFTLSQPLALARVAPLGGMAVSLIQIQAQGVALDDQTLSGPLKIDARMVPLGADSPASAQIAYDLTADMSGVDLSALPMIMIDDLPVGPVAAQGQARLWLDGTTAPRHLAAGDIPAIAGVRTGEVALSMGDLNASVIADLRADPQGRAEGDIMVYSKDGARLLDYAVQAGYMNERERKFALGMLGLISANGAARGNPIDAGRAALVQSDPKAAQDLLNRESLFRPAKPGELRLPVSFADGQTRLGNIALGPAPLIGAAQHDLSSY